MKNIKNPLILIFLGLQGSGKGTQAFEIMKKYKFDYIETGAIFRKMSKTKKGSKEAIKVMEQGKLVPSKITNEIMEKEIRKLPSSHSLIIDGYPRSMSQVYALNRALKATGRENYLSIEFKISRKTGLERLLNRWLCSKCGMIYSSNRAKCKCGGKLEKRFDEKPELIKNRFKFVSAQLENIKRYYKKKRRFLEINAERSVRAITKDLIRKAGL